nr:unnamed protein product [Digitaria exilis]
MRTHGSGSYIAASYVKFVESAGARVVPLVYDEPEERLLEVYVSTVHADRYPITCTQWHPEKAIFEWGEPMTPHSEMQYNQARKSLNRPTGDKD